jgi:hypothetical protein
LWLLGRDLEFGRESRRLTFQRSNVSTFNVQRSTFQRSTFQRPKARAQVGRKKARSLESGLMVAPEGAEGGGRYTTE